MQKNQPELPAKNQTLTLKTVVSALWSSSGTIVQFVTSVVVMVVLARLITPTDFGIVGTALVVIAFCQPFTQLGLVQVIIHRSEIEEEHIYTAFLVSVLLGVLFAGVIWHFASLISIFFRMPDLTLVMRVMGFVLVLGSVTIIPRSILQREVRFRALAIIQIIAYLIGYGLVGIVMGWQGYGLWSLVAAHLARAFLETMMTLGISSVRRIGFQAQAFRELMSFSGGMTLTHVAQFFAVQGDNFVVGRWLGAEALGIYGRAYRLMALPANLLGDGIEMVLFSTMSRIQDENERLRIAYKRGLALTALLIMPVSTFVVVMAPELVLLMLGPQWLNVILPLQLLSLAMFFRAGYKLNVTLALAKGAINQIALYRVLYGMLVLLAAAIGQFWGIEGVALGTGVVLMLFYMAHSGFSNRLVNIEWRQFWQVHSSALIVSALVLGLTQMMSLIIRPLDWGVFITLTAVFAIVFMIIGFLSYLFPGYMLGEDGQWWLRFLQQYIPARFRFASRLSGVK